MKKNEGNIDRVIRVLLGVALIVFAVMNPEAKWGFIGVVPIFTGLLGWCPLYSILGFNTCPMKKQKQ